MPATTLLELPPAEQAPMWAVLRRMRYGYLLACHILSLCYGPPPHGDGGLSVVLTLQCVPDRAGVSPREPRPPG